jgi:thiamine pyrophosphokinase
MKRSFVVGAGSLFAGDLPFEKGKDDLIIAADGGLLPLMEAGMTPDLLIGDFDSMEKPNLAVETITLPVEKDDTDTVFAVKEGFCRGYTEFVIYGGLGGSRLSHTLANIQLLSFVQAKGGKVTLVGGSTKLFLLQKESMVFEKQQKGTLSVFAYTPIATVTLQGLYYPLEKAQITNGFPLGVSNHFTGKEAKITVHDGQVLVVVEENE